MSLPSRRIADQIPVMTLFPASPAAAAAESDGDGDNITDWCLEQFQDRYGDQIKVTKNDIWEYLYGVMHAPDWREKYAHDLQRSLPRVPLADDFEAFRAAGRQLMDLHVNFETVPEHPEVICFVDGKLNEGESPDAIPLFDEEPEDASSSEEPEDASSEEPEDASSSEDEMGASSENEKGASSSEEPEGASSENEEGASSEDGGSKSSPYRIDDRMRWGRNPDTKKRDDRTILEVNPRCKLTSIPLKAHDYKVSGRSPLEWAVDSLRRKVDKASGIVDDPNGWHRWANEPFELIRHLRRLAYLGAESARIIGELPPSLSDSCFLPGDEAAADGDG